MTVTVQAGRSWSQSGDALVHAGGPGPEAGSGGGSSSSLLSAAPRLRAQTHADATPLTTNQSARRQEIAGGPRPRLLVVLLFVITAVLMRGLAGDALIDPDEGRNAAIGAAMGERGDWIIPQYNGLPYLDKPVVFFAAVGTTTALLGRSEVAARLPALLFTLATAALVYLLGRRLYDQRTALLAAVVLLSCPLVVAFSRIVIFDAAMMFWVAASLTGLYLALEEQSAAGALAAWAAAGLAVLTKGPVGLLLPVLVGVGHAIACGRPLRNTRALAGGLLLTAVVLPWFLAVTLAHPEFPHYALIRETLERVATDRMQRTGPVYYFVLLLAGGAFPWITIAAVSRKTIAQWWMERRGNRAPETFLLLWILLPFLFFTVSQSKRPGYILPVFPALALLTAHLALTTRHALRAAVAVTGLVAAAVAFAGLVGADTIASRVDEGYTDLAAIIPMTARRLCAGFAAVALLALAAWWRRSSDAAVLAMVSVVLVVAVVGGPVIGAVAEYRSSRELARAIATTEKRIGRHVRVVAVDSLPASLPFYRSGPVLVSSEGARAIRSNYIQDYSDRLMSVPDSPLRPARWWTGAMTRCRVPTVFVADRRDTAVTERLARGLRRIEGGPGRYVAYGPCGI